MARVTVSLPDALLVKLDELAEGEGISRSELVREASAHYVVHRSEKAEAHTRREAISDGLQWLQEISTEPAIDDRPSIEILRDLRDTDGTFRHFDPADSAKDSDIP